MTIIIIKTGLQEESEVWQSEDRRYCLHRWQKYAYFPEYLIDGVCNLVKQGEYDCVIGSTVSSAVLVGLMKEKLPGVRLIGWHHNSYEIYFQTPVHGFLIQRKLSAIALRKLDALITLTAHDAGKYQEQMKINAGYIYNPLSFSSQQKSALTDKILLFVGRLERKQKGIDMLLDIAEELFHHRGYGDWKLWIIGNGSGYKDTEEDIRRHGLEDQVELLGEREEVIPFYQGSICVCVHISLGRLRTGYHRGYGVRSPRGLFPYRWSVGDHQGWTGRNPYRQLPEGSVCGRAGTSDDR